MALRREVILSEEQRIELEGVRDHAKEAYIRERAAAILKVADGLAIRVVALERLNKRRTESAVRGWIDRYEAEGIGGLRVRSGRGRPPAFSPSPRVGRRGRRGTAASGSARSAGDGL